MKRYKTIVLVILFVSCVNMASAFLHSNISFNGANNGTFGANSCAQLWDDAYSTLGSWDNPTKWMSFIEGGGSSNNGCYIYENRTLQYLYFGVLISDTGSVVCSNCKLWASYDNITWRLCKDISNTSYTADGWTNYTLQSNASCAGNSLYLDVHSTQYARMGEISIYAADYDNTTKTMIINFTYPTNTTDILINNTQWNFNVSANSTHQNVSNISINVYNSSLALISHNSILHNTSGSAFLNYSIAGLADGLYYYNATAYGSGYVNASTSTFNFTVDTVAPSITNLNFTANKVYTQNITGSFNISDSHLFSLNVTLDGVVLDNKTNLVTTHYVYNLSQYAPNLTVGQHNLTIRSADGHTGKTIKEYSVTKPYANAVKYDTGKNKITVISGNNGDIITTEKLNDRYTFDYTPAIIQDEYNFTVVTEQPAFIVDRPETDYKKWIVTGDNWLDFYSDDADNTKIKIKYADDSHTILEVTIKVKNPKTTYKFKSVGDLNINIVSYIFYTLNASAVYTSPILETSNTTIYLNVNITNTTYGVNDVNATIDYNYTTHNATNKSISGSIITFAYNYLVPSVTNNTYANFTWNITTTDSNYSTLNNQTILYLNITFINCTNYTIINFTTFYEDLPTVSFNADYEYLLTYWVNNATPSVNETINGTIFDQPFFSICSVYNYSFKYNLYLRYAVDNGFNHRYYLYDEYYNGSVRLQKGGNFNTTTDTSQLNLVVRDKNTYEALSNVVATLERRYIGENIYRAVQWDRSDDYGTLYFNINEADTDYKIIFRNTSNSLIKETNDLKFLCDSGRCDLTYLLTLDVTETVASTEFNYTFNNATGILNISWTDTTLLTSSVRLLVTLETPVNSTTVCNTTVAGSSGAVGCNVSAYNGTFLVKLYSSASPEKPKISFVIVYDLTQKLVKLIGEKAGVFIAFIISLTIMGFGITLGGVGAIITGIIGLVVIYFMGVTSIITLTLIIASVIMGIVIAIKVRY